MSLINFLTNSHFTSDRCRRGLRAEEDAAPARGRTKHRRPARTRARHPAARIGYRRREHHLQRFGNPGSRTGGDGRQYRAKR